MTRPLPQAAATIQIGYIVPDLRAACEQFHAALGIGPFFWIPPRPRGNVRHHGELIDGELVTEAALAQWGDIMIELLCQRSDVPSAYRDMFAPGDSGLHHMAFWVDDYAEACEAYVAQGFQISMEMEIREGLDVAYVDTRPMLGHMVELLPRDPLVVELFDLVRRQSDAWSGGGLMVPVFSEREPT